MCFKNVNTYFSRKTCKMDTKAVGANNMEEKNGRSLSTQSNICGHCKDSNYPEFRGRVPKSRIILICPESNNFPKNVKKYYAHTKLCFVTSCTLHYERYHF